MLDPVFEWFGQFGQSIMGLFRSLWLLVTSPFRAVVAVYRRSGWILRIVLLGFLIPIVVGYAWLGWHAAWIRGYDVNYPDKFDFTSSLKATAGDQVSVEGGEESTKTCGRSFVVSVTSELIDLNVNQNNWMSSNPIYKSGFFFLMDWDQTWFMDNKAAFQRGVHQAVTRTAIELADALGRVRGTSQIDPDLKAAKGNVQFNQYTWYFNPFDNQPFGPTTSTPSYFKRAKESMDKYNDRLANCKATFDARGDNLLQFLDRVAKDIGSASAVIKQRAEDYNSGWFDTRADDIFWYAKGQLYAYYGIMKALRVDFADVVKSRKLDDIWDLMDEHLKSAIALDPFIVSNGREDGWMMPTHLTTIGFYILRARSNLVEVRSVLDR